MSTKRDNGKPNSRKTHLIEFDCHHTAIFNSPAPTLGELLWCVKCADVKMVTNAPDEYRWKCADCSVGQVHGTSKTECYRKAAAHTNKYGYHGVRIFNGKKFLGWINYAEHKRRKDLIQPLLHGRPRPLSH